MLLIPLLLALSPSQPAGDRLADQDDCYTITMTRDGKSMDVGHVRQAIRRGRQDGKEVLHVLVHQQAQGGFDMRDSFVLDAATLRPLHFENSRAGVPHVVLDYSASRVTGSKFDKDGKRNDVDVPLAAPVWEGNLFGAMFAALPLAAGGEYRVPYYQYDKGLGEFTVRVTGSEIVPTPGGPVDAWVLDAGADDKQRAQYLVGKDPRRELGYRAPGFAQSLGGDCSAMPPVETAAASAVAK